MYDEAYTFGGSFVIFTPFCSTAVGNDSEGIEVSHNRNSGCTLSASYNYVLSSAQETQTVRTHQRHVHC